MAALSGQGVTDLSGHDATAGGLPPPPAVHYVHGGQRDYKQRKAQAARSQKYREQRLSAYAQRIDSENLPNQEDTVHWCYQSYRRLHLYPQLWKELKDPNHTGGPRKPTVKEIHAANEMVHDPKVFKLFTHGKVVVLDHYHRDQILAVIEFTPIKDLLPKEKKDLQFLSHFLHESKEFVNPVKSTGQSWGGHMWALGWRKAMAAAELIGRYIKQLAVRKNPQKYDKLMSTSNRASNILV
ncbi:hypothetical protein PCANC_05599 [Puccinia coronata f. sp. avenae]|uniref:Tet-like 2OG-Fe(II) oxygenase domain-containing protein n=1 Tax=Puccinia coronata f. sp. avenae TaxID=200324 RepID=A0A2N5VWW0_9BASI|nr:hypothetical protein PCANC_05599 [Puccinia coronata f. sp. avenae]